MRIVQIPLLRDNYGYLVQCRQTNTTAIIDPSEADPVWQRAEQEKVSLTTILNTHHHRDHTGGNEGLLAKQQLKVYGHKSDRERIPGLTDAIEEGDEIQIGSLKAKVFFIPGHTTGHVAYLFGNALFCGDTLFTAGCGRLFEGTAEQMYANMQRIAALPGDVRIYCGHEYTLANGRFAEHAEPDNLAVRERLAQVKSLRDQGKITLSTTVAEERETNPFVRATNSEEFARLRTAKDSFR